LHSQTELIVLIGFMGAGKSTVGRTLARRLGWTFVDLDRWIERHEGRKIAQIFEAEGEAAFRAMESVALATVVKERSGPQVLAVGGGTWVQPANAAMLKAEQATVVFLDASPEELHARCSAKKKTRPLLQDEEQFRKLYTSRLDSYMQADMRVETGGRSVVAVAHELAKHFQAGGNANGRHK
jgi:shikimate kinase